MNIKVLYGQYGHIIAIFAGMKKNVPVYGISAFGEGRKNAYFYANDLQTHLETHQFINAPHKHSTYICVFFTQGHGVHQIDFDRFEVCPGSIFVLSPGQVHCWDLSADAEGYVFFHAREFYDNIFLHRKIDHFPFFYLQQNYPLILPREEELLRLTGLFTLLIEEYRTERLYQPASLESLTDLIYIELARLYDRDNRHRQQSGIHYEKVVKLRKLIDQHFREKKSPGQYADMLHMTTRHLSRICNEVMACSTSDLITERVILEAKRLLTHAEITIGEVASRLGYEDYSYFIRLFKKHTGLSPRAFQKSVTGIPEY